MKISIITPTSQVIGWNNPADVGISRIGVNTIGFGNGTAADITAIMQGGTLALGGATIGSNNLAITGTAIISASLAIAGATIGSNALAVTGTANISGASVIGGSVTYGAGPAILTSPAAASGQFGAADAAVAVAQTLRVQSVVAGTADTGGANWNLTGSLGTGTGTPGYFILNTGSVGNTTGSTQNAAAQAVAIGPSSFLGGSNGTGFLISQTWNTSSGPKGLVVAITNTASSGGLAFQVLGGAAGTTNLFKVDTLGGVTINGGTSGTSFTATSAMTAYSGTAIPAGGAAGKGFLLSSTSNYGVFFGSGAPSLAAAQGSLYLRSDGTGITSRAYLNTDASTGWTAITTAG